MGMRVHLGLGTTADDTLRFYRQIGVEEVSIPHRYTEGMNRRPFVPAAQTTASGPLQLCDDIDELRHIYNHIKSFDLIPTTMALNLSGNILMGRPEREEDIERVQEMIRMVGQLGIQVITYGFTALRASEGYGALEEGGRGKAGLRVFDFERICGLPPLKNVGVHSMEIMWERLEYFLRAVIPVAEESGVRLAAHPNDPPVPEYRGVAQPLYNLDSWKRLIEVVDSPSNTLFFDTGVTTELGEDAVHAIHYFGGKDRIGLVHFRNVRVEEPYYRYKETFVDEGECQMGACMRAFASVGYQGGIDPDHTPHITGDTEDTRQGWAYAIGYIRALRDMVMM